MIVQNELTKNYVCTVDYTSINGTVTTKERGDFKSYDEAQEWLNQINALLTGDKPNKKILLMNDIFNEFLNNKKRTVKEATYLKNKVIINNHFRPILNKLEIDKINHNIIQKLIFELQEKGLSNKRVNQCIKFLREIFKYANAYNDTDFNPFKLIKKLEENEKYQFINYYTEEEFEKYISKADEIVYNTFFHLLFYSGLRKGEALALNWKDIDFNNGHIKIYKSMNQKIKGKRYVIGATKNKSSNRVISLDEKTLSKLKKLKSYYQNNYESFTNTQFIFGGENPISETSIDNKNREYSTRSKQDRIRIHDFRHSHASVLINKGADVLLVSKRLGHADIKMTLNTYAHLFKNREESIIKLIS